jgi:hypothetical protein
MTGDLSESLTRAHIASLLERLPEIDVTGTLPAKAEPGEDSPTLSNRWGFTFRNKPAEEKPAAASKPGLQGA